MISGLTPRATRCRRVAAVSERGAGVRNAQYVRSMASTGAVGGLSLACRSKSRAGPESFPERTPRFHVISLVNSRPSRSR